MWDLKTLTDGIAALAAFVAAVQSWRSQGKAEAARQAAVGIKAELRTEIKASIAAALQQTQVHTQHININVAGATVGTPAIADPNPIFRIEQQEQLSDEQAEE